MELQKELKRLAQLRAVLAEAEAPLKALREEIEVVETAIKEHVSATGEVAEAAGLRVTMAAGALRCDGHLLFDCVQMMRGTLQTIHADIWAFSGLGADEKVETLSNTLSGCIEFLGRVLTEGAKQGAPVVRISPVKKGKKDE